MPPSFVIFKVSPIRTTRHGFGGWPFDSILGSSQAFAASDLVLKNRAAHSHLSIRTEVIFITYTRIHLVGNGYHYRARYRFPPASSNAAGCRSDPDSFLAARRCDDSPCWIFDCEVGPAAN